jgi:hypothetical protein
MRGDQLNLLVPQVSSVLLFLVEEEELSNWSFWKITICVYRTVNIRVRFQVFTAVAITNAVFLDFTPYGSCKNRRFG